MSLPGTIPTADEAAAFLACQFLVVELFARLDAADIDSALDLYDEDAVFLGARGKPAIRAQMVRGMAPNASRRSRHLVTNMRGSMAGGHQREVELDYTACAFTLEGPGPYAPRSVFDQHQRLRLGADGRYVIVEHLIPQFNPG